MRASEREREEYEAFNVLTEPVVRLGAVTAVLVIIAGAIALGLR